MKYLDPNKPIQIHRSDFPAIHCPWWKMLLARLLGRKTVTTDHGWRCVTYRWRGHTYIGSMDPL